MLAAPLLRPGRAAAEDARPATEELTDLLRAETAAGVRAIEAGQFQAATFSFAAAYALERSPALLFNLAQAYRKAGEAAPALVFFERFLREGPPGPLRGEAEALRAEARQRLQGPRGAADGAADRTARLRETVARGGREAEAGRYDVAARAFALAYALEPSPALLFNLAQVHRKGGRLRMALGLFERFLREGPGAGGPLRAEAESRSAEIAAQIAALYPEALAAERAGRLAEALGGYERSLREAPRGPTAEDASRRAAALRARLASAAAPPPKPAPRPLRAAGWALLGVGAGAAAAGAVLLALDGRSTCEACEPFAGLVPGAALLGVGGAALGTSAVLLGVDYRQQRGGARTALLTLRGAF